MTRFMFTAVFGLMLASTASAAMIGATDRATWLAAASGTSLGVEDFESYVSDTAFAGSTTLVTPSGLEIAQSEDDPFIGNMVDVPSFIDAAFVVDGTPYAFVTTATGTSGSDTIEIFFPTASTGVFFDSSNPSSKNLQVTAYDGATPLGTLNLPVASPVGFGFWFDSGESMTSVVIDLVSTDEAMAFGLDNIEFTGIAAVPAPPAMPLAALALAGLALRRRALAA